MANKKKKNNEAEVKEDIRETTGEAEPETTDGEPEVEVQSAEEVEEEHKSGELEKAEAERDEYRDALVRERADFENYKKRNAELASNAFGNGVIDTITAILPVLDNFERALAAESADKAFADGMSMIMRQLQDVLNTLGVEEIDTECQFDPNIHNAVMQCEEDGFDTNDIVETLQKGYKLKDKILRHAMVKVNK